MSDNTHRRSTSQLQNGTEQRSGASDDEQGQKSRKRRKVNHACVYCRRSHMTCDQQRPCSRCIKRDIGHLCHDEPGESTKTKRASNGASVDDPMSPKEEFASPLSATSNQPLIAVDVDSKLDAPQLIGMDGVSQVPDASASTSEGQSFVNNDAPFFNDWSFGGQNQFQDLHHYHPNYMFSTSEASNEYNLLNEFLTNFEDGGLYQTNESQMIFSDPTLSTYIDAPLDPTKPSDENPKPTPAYVPANQNSTQPSRPLKKMQEKYYMIAADPAGSASGEERMKKLLQAKYEAGLLKPYNYVKGYTRLGKHMDETLQRLSKQRISKQLEQFRPQFRQRMQKLTDIELVMVEMWFERKLMEYDRVFASMAMPACCWRRTGEIFRGNREMSELIGVHLEELRDGKIALHDIMAEQSLVNYWETFGSVAFDASQKAMWAACELKSHASTSAGALVKCCFSFVIQRDNHAIPSLIIGNFLPIDAPKS